MNEQDTNHSLRATTVHILDRAQIPSRHIITVTGHKSENSLKTYSGVTDEGTKKIMSTVISEKSCAGMPVISPSAPTANAAEDVDLLNIIGNLKSSESSIEEVNVSSPLDDGLDNVYRTLPLPSVATMQPLPPLPNLYHCFNLTINYSITYNN